VYNNQIQAEMNTENHMQCVMSHLSLPVEIFPKWIPGSSSTLRFVTYSLPHEVWLAGMGNVFSIRDFFSKE
jgi:hypothetical protein